MRRPAPPRSTAPSSGCEGELLVMSLISACVIARDEAENLSELLPTLRWADELLVLIDAATRDRSVEIAVSLAHRVEVQPFSSFSSFRNVALSLARGPWVFFVDADERVSAALAEEVRAVVGESEREAAAGNRHAVVGYWVPRHNIIFGRLVQGGGWSPDYQLRLMRCDRARYDEGRVVHETVLLDGPAAHLHERLLHLNYRTLGQFFEKQRRYTTMEAASLRAQGVRFRRRALLGQPLRQLIRHYLLLGGWRDGPVGLFLSLAMAYYTWQRVRLVRRAT